MELTERKLAWYLQILLSSSWNFPRQLKELKKVAANLTGAALKKELDQFAKVFFITPSEQSRKTLLALIHSQSPSKLYSLHVDHLASPESPGKFTFTEPSVIIQIKGQLRTAEDWKALTQELQTKEAEINKLVEKQIFKDLPALKPYREHGNIDFDLELYRLHTESNYSPARMALEQSEIKVAAHHNKTTVYTAKELSDRLKLISKLVAEL